MSFDRVDPFETGRDCSDDGQTHPKSIVYVGFTARNRGDIWERNAKTIRTSAQVCAHITRGNYNLTNIMFLSTAISSMTIQSECPLQSYTTVPTSVTL